MTARIVTEKRYVAVCHECAWTSRAWPGRIDAEISADEHNEAVHER